jgi:hypothetical protein
MASRELKSLSIRMQVWPKGAQDEAIKALREIEEDFVIGPATRPELDRSHQETLHGEGISHEDLLLGLTSKE